MSGDKIMWNTRYLPDISDMRKMGYKVRVGHWRKVYPIEGWDNKEDFEGEPTIEPHLDAKPPYAYVLVGRRDDTKTWWQPYVDQHGGVTRVEVTTPEGEQVLGEAHVNPKDSYNYHLGFRVALGRALAQLNGRGRSSGANSPQS